MKYETDLYIRHCESYGDIILAKDEVVIPSGFAEAEKLKIDGRYSFKLTGNVSDKFLLNEISLPQLLVRSFSNDNIIYLNYFKNKELLKELFFEKRSVLYEYNDSYFALREEYNVRNFVFEINTLSRLLTKYRLIPLLFSLFGILFVSLVSANYYGHVLNKQKKNIYILLSLGYKRKNIVRSYAFGLYVLMAFAFLITTICIIFVDLNLNSVNYLRLRTFWFQFRYYYLIIMFLYLVVIFFLCWYFIFKVNKNKSLSQNMKIS